MTDEVKAANLTPPAPVACPECGSNDITPFWCLNNVWMCMACIHQWETEPEKTEAKP